MSEDLIRTRERVASVIVSAAIGVVVVVMLEVFIGLIIYAIFGELPIAVVWVFVGIAGFAAFVFGSMGWTDPPWGGKTFQAIQWEREAAASIQETVSEDGNG